MRQFLGTCMDAPWPQSGHCMGLSLGTAWAQAWAQAQARWGSLVQIHLTLYKKKNPKDFSGGQGQSQNPWPWSLQEG